MLKKIFVFIVAIVLILAGVFIYYEVEYVGDEVDPFTYFDEFKNNKNNLVYDDTRVDVEEPVVEIDGRIFLRYEFINQYINDRVFYDYNEKKLTLTSAHDVVRLQEGDNTINYLGIDGVYTLKTINDALYISSNLVEDFFNVTIEKSNLEHLYIATNAETPYKTATIKNKSSIRTHQQKKSKVVEKIEKEDVIVYSSEDGFSRIRSKSGMVGYVPTNELVNSKIGDTAESKLAEGYELNPLGETVKLMWDQTSPNGSVDLSSGKYANMSNINVLVPTWFQFEDEKGTLSNGGSSAYIEQAHAKGIKVFAMVRQNFEQPELTKPILTSTVKRQKVINQILAFADTYKFDGVNIDIENIQEDFSSEWVQFMRELYPQLKAKGLIVTVDVYMPSEWSTHYCRNEVSECCDYFMVMAYDQHWASSKTAGSVAEIPWVEEGIKNSLTEVPKEKLVLGIPLYARIWIESPSGLISRAYGMDEVQSIITKAGAKVIFDKPSGQKYAEFQTEEGAAQIWIEDYDSIKKRLSFIETYKLAGYAAWRLGNESADIWELFKTVK